MRILLMFDKNFNIDGEKLLNFLKQKLKYIEFNLYQENVEFNSHYIDESLNNIFEVVSNIKKYDKLFIFTDKPYKDNYFLHIYKNNVVICSFYNWNEITNLNKTNGIVYFIIDSLALSINPNDFRHKETTGCIYDFLWDKTGVDDGMRQARICPSCLKRLNGNLDKNDSNSLILGDLQRLMLSLSNASKEDKDILERVQGKNISLEIKELSIYNFRGIEKQTFKLLPNINLFVGVNGAGKSTILDALAISLSWLVERIQKADAKGEDIPDDSIKNGKNYSSISLKISEDNKIYKWKNVDSVRGYPSKQRSELLRVDELAYFYQEQYQKYNQLPMIAYYPINRIAKGIQTNIRGKDSFSQLDVYDNALLSNKANFQAFFEWFRLQDDIINEQSTSRTKWMRQHKHWLISELEDSLIYIKDKNKDKINRWLSFLQENDDVLIDKNYIFYLLTEFIQYYEYKGQEYSLMHLSYVLGIIGKLNDDFETKKFQEIIIKILNNIFKEKDIHIIDFLLKIFQLSILLTFWWISKESIENIKKVFNESNNNIKNNFFIKIKKILENDKKRLEQTVFNKGRELKFVIQTIEKFIPEYSNLRVTRIPTPHMLVEKNGETIRLDQLSDGEKNMIAMIGDIARRLSMANPMMENPLTGNGIILIDEIDLHLHPSWQRLIVPKLIEVFANCQFIITTHSPQILSHVKAEHIFLLQQKDGNMTIKKPTESFGKSSDRQLEDNLDVDARPLEIKKELHKLFKLIQNGDLDKAREIMSELEDKIEGREPELVKANVLIKRKEILGK